MFENLILHIKLLSEQIPVGLYALVGGFIEEIIAPIPSPLIMTTAGSLLRLQGQGIAALFLVSFLAAFGKTIGSWIIYLIADKSENLIILRFGKFLGVTRKDVENIGKRFDNTWKDDVLLVLLRAIPFIPGAPVAVVCGIIKLNPKRYLRSTLAGTFLRSLIFGFIGYEGLATYQTIISRFNALETAGAILFVLLVSALLIWLYSLRKSGGIQGWMQKHFGKENGRKDT
ncbi:MAG: VTT domain-containing protein [Candidatus Omnitrophica bacterium]|nr:VTT domain-containing protein [Candidatus Omnitrophota bacterium]